MAVGFNSIPFAVYPDSDGFLPQPTAGEGNNPRTYAATVRLTSGTAVSNLRALKSVVTVDPASGFVSGGTIVVEAGPGTRSLVYPTADGAELTVDAILTDLAPVGHMANDEYRVDATFLLVE